MQIEMGFTLSLNLPLVINSYERISQTICPTYLRRFTLNSIDIGFCKKSSDTVLSLADTQNVNGESAADAFIGDATDMATLAVGSISSSTYRKDRSWH